MDRRIERTKNEIQRAALELLKKKNLIELSVTEICEKANVGRSTFYVHYNDINDLISNIEDKKLSDIVKLCMSNKDIPTLQICLEVAKNIKQNKTIFKILLMKTNQHFQNKIRAQFKIALSNYSYANSNFPHQKYFFTFIIQGAISVFSEWIIDDCKIAEEELINSLISHMKYEFSK